MAMRLEDLDALVISLERTPQRLDAFRQRFAEYPGEITHLPGVDGAELDVAQLQQQGLIDPSVQTWPRGQVGCALSHIKALMHCRRHGRPLLIFEDDALPAPEWQEHLKVQLQRAPDACDVLLLGWNLDSCLQLSWAPGQTFTSLFQPRFPDEQQLSSALAAVGQRQWLRLQKGLGLAGYVVTPAAADTILNWALPLRTLPIQVPELPERPCFSFDGQLNSLYPSLQAWALFPPLVLGLNDKRSSETAG